MDNILRIKRDIKKQIVAMFLEQCKSKDCSNTGVMEHWCPTPSLPRNY